MNKIFSFVLILIGLFIFTGAGCGYLFIDPPLDCPDNAGDLIGQIVNTTYDNGQFMGAVLVSVKGEIVYKNAFGYANIRDSILNTTDTKFRIASFTKPFTAMLILQLVEEGLLQLDGKLTEYLPDFPEEKGKNITIHQLLTHTSGITGESRISNLIDIEKEYYSRKRLFDCIVKRALVFEPGEGREYSNFGFALLGLIIEAVTGKTYDEVLQEKICRPAGMKNTLCDVSARPIENRAIGYVYDYFTGLEEASFLDMSFVFGYGHLLSTVEDLYLFDKALYTNTLLTENSKELFFHEYGWFPERSSYGNGSKRIHTHNLDGSINGFQSHTQRIEKDTVLIVILRNVKESDYRKQIVIKWASCIAFRVLAVLYNEEYDLPKKSAAFTIFKTLIESGEKDAEMLYTEISNKHPVKYYVDDSEWEYFGDRLTGNGMPIKAKQYQNILLKVE